MKAPQRSKSLQIYMKPGIREDDLLLEVWDACAQFDRPQDVFRTILRRGLRAMVETGDMPKAVRDACDLENRLDKRRGRGRQESVAPQQPYPYPPQPPYHPYPPQGYNGYPAPFQGQPVLTQPPMGHWSAEETHDSRHTPERGHAPDQGRQHMPSTQTVPDYERGPSEEKAPAEPPRAIASPAPDKRQEHPPPPIEETRPAASAATYGKGKKLGNIM